MTGASVNERGFTAVALLGLTLVPLGQVHVAFGVVGAALCLWCVVAGRRSRSRNAVRLGTLAPILDLVGAFGIPFAMWLTIGAMWLASLRWNFLAPAIGWLPAVRAGPLVWWSTLGIVVGAPIGIVIWFRSTDRIPEMTTDLMDLAREVPTAGLALAGVTFVTVNSLIEEMAYRGVAFEGASSIASPPLAIVSQAVAFGTFHVSGIPSGAPGVVLAFIYGLTLGWIRHISGGLLFPIVAHIVADAAILTLVLVMI